MRRLILLRHAKAVAHDPKDDRHRKLSDRGERDAERVGIYLAKQTTPQFALVSPAARTRETFGRLSLAFDQPIEATYPEALYGAEPDDILEAIANVRAGIAVLMVVGHNPGIADLARGLAGSGDRRGLREMVARFPTAALAVIEFRGDDWTALAAGAGRLTAFVTPAALGGGADLD